MEIHWLKIKDIITETTEIKTFMLERPDGFSWEVGAHTHFALKGFNAGSQPNRSLVRHMSISTTPSEDVIGITTRIKQPCSEFKTILGQLTIGDEVAMFKTYSNLPLKREDRNVYLLSSGVGLATFRPLVLDYFSDATAIKHMHSLNVESSKQFLFQDLVKTSDTQNFSAQFVDNRKDYYMEVERLAEDKNGIFYVVGSDEFLSQNIALLRENHVPVENIMLDKHEEQKLKLLS